MNLSELVTSIGAVLSDYVLVSLLLVIAVYFTLRGRGLQFTMIGEMLRLLVRSGRRHTDASSAHTHGSVSSFQAFALSIASRVGTGNLAGVATAITIGGPGAVFWMWVIAILGAATSFVESTLGQLFKVKGEKSFIGGPAYYISKGLHKKWWAATFAVLITLTFGFAFNSVQSNTIADALHLSFGLSRQITGIVIALLTLIIVFGGVTRVSRFSEIVVPIMAVAYIILAMVIIVLNIHRFPDVLRMIFENAFGYGEVLGGTVGSAMIMGIKRGLFSNEAGEGSTPNAAATATVSHPVKQGLIQAFGVYTDTLIVCSATAFIILCSGVVPSDYDGGIILTQKAIDTSLGGSNYGSTFVCIAIFFFAFTSIIANYYYGEANIRFLGAGSVSVGIYRLCVGAIVYIGALTSLDFVWGFADITMALMTLCNLAAIILLGKYAFALLKDYKDQKRRGLDPVYHSSTLPEIADDTECWS